MIYDWKEDFQGKIEGVWPPLHARGVEDPLIYDNAVSVKELAYGELPLH